MLDNGGGPKASYSGAVFYKADGGVNWNVESSLTGSQTTTATDSPSGGGAFQTLRIVAQPVAANRVEAAFFIDVDGGSNFVQCRDAEGRPIKHVVTLGSPTEMAIVLGVKAGGANAETLLVQLRVGHATADIWPATTLFPHLRLTKQHPYSRKGVPR